MAPTRLLGDPESGQDVCTGLVPSRMDLIDEWDVDQDSGIELYTDDRAGDGWLILVSDHSPEEHIATVFHAGGVTRATIWRGTATEQSELWRDRERRKAIASIAARHADIDTNIGTGTGQLVTASAEPDEAAA